MQVWHEANFKIGSTKMAVCLSGVVAKDIALLPA